MGLTNREEIWNTGETLIQEKVNEISNRFHSSALQGRSSRSEDSRPGGTASKAMVAAAAMIAVRYPHMNSIGGDGFCWSPKGQTPVAIDGCGAAALEVDVEHYRSQGEELPEFGGEAAITMAGTVAAWQRR